MANANTEITLQGVHVAMVDGIRAAFPIFQTVREYDEDRTALAVPACEISMGEFESTGDASDPGTEQQAVTARFEARIIVGMRQDGENPKMVVRQIAAAVSAFLRLRRWGLPIGPAEFLGAYPDQFEPALDQYECWRVEWTHVLHLGESVWKEGSGQPTPYFSYAPDIGEGHEQEYETFAELPKDEGAIS